VTVVLVKVIERAVRAGDLYKGWSKLPSSLTPEDELPGSQDLTVIGPVSCEDPTTIFKRPAAASGRKS